VSCYKKLLFTDLLSGELYGELFYDYYLSVKCLAVAALPTIVFLFPGLFTDAALTDSQFDRRQF
jgi:hypothetical protein